ncbi:sugar ABC transporter permease [Paraburkholderia aromaticivorans]|uniref:Transport permease protein n=2 Tax=Paraburkholderia aromaticivorans TaxID=2026199 RepID=A0A248VMH6_9BURK|nr:ABC transporter permease [Paraburkholderia aromaticivorans]ASW00227.1 sugar ABC transporter permease [Paraburkholderia aromaticivorans]
MTKREVIGRYRGSVFGLAWSFFNPVLMLAVYTFVFSFVFKSRWGAAATAPVGHGEFAMMLFVGMTVHALFAECINRSPLLVLQNASYVKKVIFPLEIFPVIALCSAVFHLFISMLVLVAGLLLVNGSVHLTVLLFPLVVLPLFLLSLGVGWFLAATGVYVRDIAQATAFLASVLMFLSPVFYPISALPEKYRIWLQLNPLTFFIEESRAVLVGGSLPDFAALGLYLVASVVVAWLGYWWFQSARRGFADVI